MLLVTDSIKAMKQSFPTPSYHFTSMIHQQTSGSLIPPSSDFPKYRFCHLKATFTRPINTGTSTKGPITAAKASSEFMPKTATATAIANSKLLLAAVNESVVVFE